MWTLILTIYIHVNSGTTVAITNVDNIRTYEDCDRIASSWEKEQYKLYGTRRIIIEGISKLCVKKG